MKERTSSGSFLQWPDLICRNGAAWAGGKEWCSGVKKLSTERFLYYSFHLLQTIKIRRMAAPWQPLAGGTILSTKQGFYSSRR